MDYTQLTFEEADIDTFQNLRLAMEAMAYGGTYPCILNAANEVAVQSFLEDELSFLGMSDVIEKCLHKVDFIAKPTLEDYENTDAETRRMAKEIISKISVKTI